MRVDVGYDSLLFGVELLEHDGTWRSLIHLWDQLGYVAPEHDDGGYDTDTKEFGDIGGARSIVTETGSETGRSDFSEASMSSGLESLIH